MKKTDPSHIEHSSLNIDSSFEFRHSSLARVWPSLLLITLIVTVLNAIKPLTMDDSAYFAYARQIAQHPLDPYGFQVFWAQWPEPANWLLAPPAIPYWWAIAIRFFGPSVFVWKLWLLPWIAAFVFAVHALLRRFAPSVALPITLFTAFAPIYLPAINYMLDVPALGLGLLALCVSMRGIDRRSIGWLLLSGFLFGVALQTKYNTFTLPALAALYGITRKRWALAFVPGLLAVGVFAGWELFVAHTYGQSHFLLHLRGPDLFEGRHSRYQLIWGAVTLLGGLAGPLTLLMALALNVSQKLLLLGGVILVASFGLTALEPVAIWVFSIVGLVAWLCSALCLRLLISRPHEFNTRKDDQVLIGWFAFECAAFVCISPFEATRRLMGIFLVLTLVAARLLDSKPMPRSARLSMRWIVGLGVALGCFFWSVDLLDARAERDGAQRAVAIIHQLRGPGERAYYRGHWGFQFYCEQAGLLPVVPDHTQLIPGDWVVFPSINSQRAALPLNAVRQVSADSIDDTFHLETQPTFYGRLLAIDHRDIPRLTWTVYQVTEPFIPPTTYPPQMLVDWALTRPMPLMPMSITALLRATHYVDHSYMAAVQQVIGASGTGALVEASHDSDPYFRQWAQAQLTEMSAAQNRRMNSHD